MADKLEGAEAQAAWLYAQGEYDAEDIGAAIRDAGMTGNRYDMLRIAERSKLARQRTDAKARNDTRYGGDE